MNTEQLRAEFEAWFKGTDHYLSKVDFCLMPNGRYEDEDVDVAFEAYQAGRAAGIRDGRTTAYDSASRMEQMSEDGL